MAKLSGSGKSKKQASLAKPARPPELDLHLKFALNTYSLVLLQPLMNGPLLPQTTASMSPLHVHMVITDIIVNNRRNILELGSGISTILIARLIKLNKLDAHVISIDHDGGWVDVVKKLLQDEGLQNFVTIVHAPLLPQHSTEQHSVWYDKDVLRGILSGMSFDMMIVDGPPAFAKGYERSRYPALPFFINYLKNDFSLYLDDANRPGEQWILNQWKEEFSIEYQIRYAALGCLYRGRTFHLGLI